jgi:hypothetical protein
VLAAIAPFGALPQLVGAATADQGRPGLTPDALSRDLCALAERLHPATSIRVADLQIQTIPGGDVRADLRVHLAWLPGERRMPYRAVAADTGLALAALRDRITAEMIALHAPLLRGTSGSRHQVKPGRA